MARKRAERTCWVSYLRVSTVEQAEKELSLTAQRRSAEEFAARHGAFIDHHYVEPGASGTDTHRTVFNELLGAALRPGSTIAVILVHHTSRFTRDATHARVVKTLRAGKLACPGLRVRVEDLDGAVLAAIVDLACTPARAERLARRHNWPPTTEVMNAWRNFTLCDHDIGRTYALHLIERIDVHSDRIVITPKDAGGRKEIAMLGVRQ